MVLLLLLSVLQCHGDAHEKLLVSRLVVTFVHNNAQS